VRGMRMALDLPRRLPRRRHPPRRKG
jgi:hypothetical protein